MFNDAYKQKYGEFPGSLAAYGFHTIEVILEAVKVAKTTDTEAVIDTMESMTFQESIMSPDYHFRKADHQPITGLYSVEAVADTKYQYGTKILGYDPKPTVFVVPDKETGCDPYMKKKS